MKTAVRPQTALLLLLVLIIGIALGLLIARPLFQKHSEEEEQDPHAGQVWIYDGFDWVWMTPLEGVPVNAMAKEDFQMVGGRPVYQGAAYETRLGLDVSEHQYEIDWDKVANANLDFVYIRLGYRGNTEGGLFLDPWFEKNYAGAGGIGLDLGVYFYSQAISVEEAEEEARFVLQHLDGRALQLPIVYDWEKVEGDGAEKARTKDVDLETRTACAVAFCETVKAAGYDAAVYFNRNLGYYGYDLRELTDYSFWFALPLNPPDLFWPSFYYKVDIWQFSFSETIPGIEGETDMNMLFIPRDAAQDGGEAAS